jgi:hypothetical protein
MRHWESWLKQEAGSSQDKVVAGHSYSSEHNVKANGHLSNSMVKGVQQPGQPTDALSEGVGGGTQHPAPQLRSQTLQRLQGAQKIKMTFQARMA